VPQGKETDWQYGSSEGRSQLAASANFKRLVVVTMHREQVYTDMQAVQAELSQVVMELAPPGMPENQQVTAIYTDFPQIRMCFCFTSNQIMSGQRKAVTIFGNKLLPSQGQTDIHCKNVLPLISLPKCFVPKSLIDRQDE